MLLTLLALLATLPDAPARAEPVLGDDPAIDHGAFLITPFATGLSFPYGMLRLDDGSLLVATSSTTATSGSFWSAPGRIVRLVDVDDDGLADAPPALAYGPLPARATGLARAGALVVVVTSQESFGRLTFLRMGATADDPLSLAGVIDLDYDNHVYHQTYSVAARPSPTVSGAHDLVFNVGSAANAAATTSPVIVSGLVSGSVPADSLIMVTVADLGTTLAASDLTPIALGLRNAAGLAFDPETGDLWLQDNGIDTPGNANEPLSADELNVIPHAQIGTVVHDFGFPDDYITYRTGAHVGDGLATQPVVAFQPLPDPSTGAESEGAAQITFAPPAFPPPFDRGIFVGFHGRFSTAGPANEENALAFYDLAADRTLHFIPPAVPGVGHLDGLLASGDSLFVSDFSTSGGFTGASGAIYRIRNARLTCEATPLCIASPDALVVFGLVQGPGGLGSFRCVARPGHELTCDLDADGRLAIGPPMCQPP